MSRKSSLQYITSGHKTTAEEVRRRTDTHHLYRTSQVLWPHRTCWSIHGPQPSGQVQCGPLIKGLEPQINPTSPNLALHSWVWCHSTQHWSGSCLSSSTKSTGMQVAGGNGNVHWTSHMMMTMMMTFENTMMQLTTWCCSLYSSCLCSCIARIRACLRTTCRKQLTINRKTRTNCSK